MGILLIKLILLILTVQGLRSYMPYSAAKTNKKKINHAKFDEDIEQLEL